MKTLIIFLLFITTNSFTQTIDCQELDKMNGWHSSKKRTIRTQTFSETNLGKNESVMEIDTTGNYRSIIKTAYQYHPLGERLRQLNLLSVNGTRYMRSNKDSVWEYETIPVQDTSIRQQLLQKRLKFENCQKIGSEVIDGRNYDIIETNLKVDIGTDSSKICHLWLNFQDSSFKKMEISMLNSFGFKTKSIMEYDVYVAPIEKPLDAVPKIIKTSNRKTPEFKGGSYAQNSFIKSHLEYPKIAHEAKIEGSVSVAFTVETDGSICDIHILKGIGYGCDEAAIELVKKTSGEWLPALFLGKPIQAKFILPVRFKL